METTTEILALGAVASAIAAAIILVRVHLLPGGHAWPPPPLGEINDGPYHAYHRALVLLLGLSAALMVVALDRGTEAEALGLAFLGVHAGARLAGAFDVSERVGLVVTAVAITALAFGAADITNAIEGSPGWSEGTGSALRGAADAIGVTAVLTLAASIVPIARERSYGLVERMLCVAAIAWLLIASVHLATLAGGSL